jgi:hypothetical protein
MECRKQRGARACTLRYTIHKAFSFRDSNRAPDDAPDYREPRVSA